MNLKKLALLVLLPALLLGRGVGAQVGLSPEQLALARQVHLGVLPCESGVKVSLSADPKAVGYFNLQLGQKQAYRMSPVLTSTGSVRLEDQRAGMVWLQLADKSMLLNQKLGKRVADDCKSPAQRIVAQSQAKNPPQPGLLDAPISANNPLRPSVGGAK